MAEPRESISLFKGYAYLGRGRDPHIAKEYDIVQDVTAEGVRTIVLRERDLTAYRAKVDEAVDLLLERLDEADSRTTRGLLRDVLGDYEERRLDEIIRKARSGWPVKVREGCFKILIGDGRRKSGIEIMLRE